MAYAEKAEVLGVEWVVFQRAQLSSHFAGCSQTC